MSRQELHATLDAVIRSWVAATCRWEDGWWLGDYRFVVLSIDVAPRAQVYVQLWSEPLEPVSWEVSSGRWNPPVDKWLAGERSERIAAFGFEIGGNAENFQREVTIRSRADLTNVARTIVDILYACFDYRGMAKLNARICYQSRAQLRPVLTSLTPEDLVKVFKATGYALVGSNDDDDDPVLQFRTRGLLVSVIFGDRVPDQRLFESAAVICDVALTPGDAARSHALMNEGPTTEEEVNPVAIGTTLHVAGGVTIEWLTRRVSDWTDTIVSYRRQVRRKQQSVRTTPGQLVH